MAVVMGMLPTKGLTLPFVSLRRQLADHLMRGVLLIERRGSGTGRGRREMRDDAA